MPKTAPQAFLIHPFRSKGLGDRICPAEGSYLNSLENSEEKAYRLPSEVRQSLGLFWTSTPLFSDYQEFKTQIPSMEEIYGNILSSGSGNTRTQFPSGLEMGLSLS